VTTEMLTFQSVRPARTISVPRSSAHSMAF
jgi:hypothetical protein